nr:hypothetical protein [Tanacetum cinerariifolium]
PNGDALRKCILEGPYTLSTIVVPAIPATKNSPAVSEHTIVETLQTMSPENKAHYKSKKEAIHLIQQENKDMQKNLALIAKYFKKIYKPTSNNLRTSLNSRNKNVDTTLRYRNDNQYGQFGSQRTVNVVGARENVGSRIVQQTGIQYVNCKEFGHFAKECRKPKRVKDSTYHKEKMLMCKQAEQGVQYKDEYNVFPNVNQHCKQSKSTSNTCLVEKDDSDVTPDSLDMCGNDIQTDQNVEDERVALANLIENLKLDVDKNKKIQKQLNKANTLLAHELEQCKSILAETSKTLEESNSVQDSCLVTLQTKQTKFEKYKAVSHKTNVCIPQLRSNQLTDKVVPNNSHVKAKKTKVEDHHRISSISNKTKSVTTCNDSLNSRTLNVNAVCATCEKCLIDSNHIDYVTRMLNAVNPRIKKPNVVPISTKKPKGHANKSVATPPKKKVASKSITKKPKSYYRMMYEKTSKTWKWWIEQQCPSGYKWVPRTKIQWVPKVRNENVEKRVSFAIDNVSRITNVLKLTNSLGSNLSNVPSSSNSLTDCSTHPIHC